MNHRRLNCDVMQRVKADLVYDLRQLILEFNDPFLPHSRAQSITDTVKKLLPIFFLKCVF